MGSGGKEDFSSRVLEEFCLHLEDGSRSVVAKSSKGLAADAFSLVFLQLEIDWAFEEVA